jgi:mRNA-degrading endonuclease toxin of MazEF toxin-antitoxin module
MLKQGSIVQATVGDPQGQNAKLRPLVIVSPTADLATAEEVFAVAITGRFAEPLQGDEVRLPFHPGGQAKSGLRKPSIAKCSWLVTLRPEGVAKQSGFLNAETMTEILRKVGQLRPAPSKSPGDKGS